MLVSFTVDLFGDDLNSIYFIDSVGIVFIFSCCFSFVYQMIQSMSNTGFRSPISPPESFLECNREVPSPSQYSDPSPSPPSMHSPSHNFCSEADKFENFLKEEPASPYNGTFATTLQHQSNVAADNSFQISNNNLLAQATDQQQQHCHQQQQQQYQMQQQQQQYQQQRVQQSQQYSGNKLADEFTHYQVENCVTDYDLQQILNHPEIAKTVDCLMTQEDLLFQANTESSSLQFPVIQSPPPSGVGVSQFASTPAPQHHNFSQMSASADLFTAAAMGDQSAHLVVPTTVISNSDVETFESLIDIKKENDADCQQLDAFFIMDTIMKNIITEARVSHSEYTLVFHFVCN